MIQKWSRIRVPVDNRIGTNSLYLRSFVATLFYRRALCSPRYFFAALLCRRALMSPCSYVAVFVARFCRDTVWNVYSYYFKMGIWT
jgi:hypothetical protein